MATQDNPLAPQSVVIRLATPADISQIEAFLPAFVASGDVLPRTLRELEALLPTFFIAEHEGQIVGCVTLEVYNWKLAEVRSLAVSPTMRGLGLGRRLVQACVDLARSREILEVMAITRNDEFFIACGFDFTLPNLKRALFLQTGDDVVRPRHIQISTRRALPAPAVHRLLRQTDWADTRSLEDVAYQLAHTAVNIGAWDDDTLVGYARALSDGRFRALIEDVVIDQSRRNEGIGRALIEGMLSALDNVQEVILQCSDENVTFYAKFGFERAGGNTMRLLRG